MSGQILTSRWLELGSTRMHYRAGPPSGPPLVLVHGLGVSSRYMVPVGELLAQRFTVYAPDLPGFGRTPRPGRALHIYELAYALADWLDIMGLRDVALLTNSLGCQICAELTVRRPDLPAALIFVGATVDPAAPSLIGQGLRAARDIPYEKLGLWPVLIGDYLTAGLWYTLQTFRAALGHRIEDCLPQIAVPALVLSGEHDPITPDVWVQRMAQLLPRGRAAILPGASHAPNFSMPRQLAAVATQFLSEVGFLA